MMTCLKNKHSGHSLRTGTAGYTLLEIALALGIGILFASICIPMAMGWITEQKFRAQADGLIGMVQKTAQEAETTGTSLSVIFTDEKKDTIKQLAPNERIFQPGSDCQWLIVRNGKASKEGRIRISSDGFVEPVFVRLEKNGKWLEFRFDLLTAHVAEEKYSF